MGHLDQVRSNLQSTLLQKTIDTEFFPNNNNNYNKLFETILQLVCFSPKEFAYGDLAGAFPFKSSRGNKHLYILYNYDSNAIMVHPLKTIQAAEIKTAWETLYHRLTQHGHRMSNFILDNEFSQDLKKSLKKYNVDYQFVPPHIHRANAAERAICTFKSHFLAGLSSCDPQFPIGEWDHSLDKAELTSNLLQTARCNPKLSPHAYNHGVHDFHREPLAPPGTKVVVHQKPQV